MFLNAPQDNFTILIAVNANAKEVLVQYKDKQEIKIMIANVNLVHPDKQNVEANVMLLAKTDKETRIVSALASPIVAVNQDTSLTADQMVVGLELLNINCALAPPI